jgi:hypothetical protein
MNVNHNVLFDQAQEEYLKTLDKKHMDQMYLICRELAKRYIAKCARARGLNIDVDERAHDASTILIGMYLRKPDFRLNLMSGYMCRCCNSVLWKDKTWNKKTVSMEPLIEMELI